MPYQENPFGMSTASGEPVGAYGGGEAFGLSSMAPSVIRGQGPSGLPGITDAAPAPSGMMMPEQAPARAPASADTDIAIPRPPAAKLILAGMLGGPQAVEFVYQQHVNQYARPAIAKLGAQFRQAIDSGDYDTAQQRIGDMSSIAGKAPQFGPLVQKMGEQLAERESNYRKNNAYLDVLESVGGKNPQLMKFSGAMRTKAAIVPLAEMTKLAEKTFPTVTVGDTYVSKVSQITGEVTQETLPPTFSMKDLTPQMQSAWAAAQVQNPGMMGPQETFQILNKYHRNEPVKKSELDAVGLAQQAMGEQFKVGVTAERIPTLPGMEQQALNGPTDPRAQALAGFPQPGQAPPPQGMPQQGPPQPPGAMMRPGQGPRPVQPGAVPRGDVEGAIQRYGTPGGPIVEPGPGQQVWQNETTDQRLARYKQMGVDIPDEPQKPQPEPGESPADYGVRYRTWQAAMKERATKIAQNIADFQTKPAEQQTITFYKIDPQTGKIMSRVGLSAAQANTEGWTGFNRPTKPYLQMQEYFKLEPRAEKLKTRILNASEAATGGTFLDAVNKAITQTLARTPALPNVGGSEVGAIISMLSNMTRLGPVVLSREQRMLLTDLAGYAQNLEKFINPEGKENADIALVKQFLTAATANRESMHDAVDQTLQQAYTDVKGMIQGGQGQAGQASRPYGEAPPLLREQQQGGSVGQKMERQVGTQLTADKESLTAAWQQFRQTTEGPFAEKARKFLSWAAQQGAAAAKAAGEVVEMSRTKPPKRRAQRHGPVNADVLNRLSGVD